MEYESPTNRRCCTSTESSMASTRVFGSCGRLTTVVLFHSFDYMFDTGDMSEYETKKASRPAFRLSRWMPHSDVLNIKISHIYYLIIHKIEVFSVEYLVLVVIDASGVRFGASTGFWWSFSRWKVPRLQLHCCHFLSLYLPTYTPCLFSLPPPLCYSSSCIKSPSLV